MRWGARECVGLGVCAGGGGEVGGEGMCRTRCAGGSMLGEGVCAGGVESVGMCWGGGEGAGVGGWG